MSTISRTKIRIIALTWKLSPKSMPSGAGVVQGRLAVKLFIPSVSTKNLNIHTFTIGARINGIKKIGFNTNGAPNRIGSFTPKKVGTTDALPTTLFLFDFASSININGTTSVAPVPPKVTINICVPAVITLSACSPACIRARFTSAFEYRIAAIAGSTIDGPWIPINQKNA